MYAVIGRKQTELDNLNVEYDRLLFILAQVLSGQLAADKVTVDIPGRRWTVETIPVSETPSPETTVQ